MPLYSFSKIGFLTSSNTTTTYGYISVGIGLPWSILYFLEGPKCIFIDKCKYLVVYVLFEDRRKKLIHPWDLFQIHFSLNSRNLHTTYY